MSRDFEILKESGIKYESPEAYDHPIIGELKQQLAAEKERADNLKSDYELVKDNFSRLKEERDFWEEARAKHKERADKAEAREQKLREAIERYRREGMYNDAADTFFEGVLASLYPKEETK